MDGPVHSSHLLTCLDLMALTHPHSPTGTESSTEIGHHDFAVHGDISCYKQRPEKFIPTLPTYLFTYSLPMYIDSEEQGPKCLRSHRYVFATCT